MFKKIFVGVSVLVLVLVIALGVVLWNINPLLESFKPEISRLISDAVKQPVLLGEISARFFPSVAIEIKDVQLEGIDASRKSEASIKSLLLDTSLIQLLTGKVSVTKLDIKDADFTLIRETSGNITLAGIELLAPASPPASPLAKPSDASSPPPGKTTAVEPKPATKADTPSFPSVKTPMAPAPSKPVTTAKAEKKSSLSLQVKQAAISNSNIVFIDKFVTPNQELRIDDIEVEVSDIDIRGSGSLELKAKLLGSNKHNLTIVANAKPETIFMGLPELDAKIDLTSLDMTKVFSIARAYKVAPPDLKLGKELSLKLSVRLDKQGIFVDSDVFATETFVAYGEAFEKAAGTPLSLRFKAQPSLSGAVHVPLLELGLGGIKIHSSGTINPAGESKLNIETKSFPLATLGDFLPPAKPFDLKGELHANLDLSASGKTLLPASNGTIELKNAGAAISLSRPKPLAITDANGKITLKEGKNLSVKPFVASIAGQKLSLGAKATALFAKPDLQLAVKIEHADLAPIIQSAKPELVEKLGIDSFIEGLEFVQTYSVNGERGTVSLSIKKANAAQVPIEGLKVSINCPKGIVDLESATASVFGGSLALKGTMKTEGVKTLSTSVKGSNFDLGQVSKLAGPNSKLRAKGTLENLTATLKTQTDNPLPTLTGTALAKAVDGAIVGVNIVSQVLSKLDKIPGIGAALSAYIPEKYRGQLMGDSTAFESLVLDSKIGNSKIDLKSLVLKHALYVITGTGIVGLDGSVDLKTQLKLTSELTQQMVLKEPKLKLLMDRDRNLIVPVIIRKKKDGIIMVLPDAAALIKTAAKSTVREAAGRAIDRVAPGAGRALQSLFGN